jgi:hypothetical protein
MKAKILMILLLLVVSSAFTLPAQKESEYNRQLYQSSYHNTGNILLRISNYGFLGSGDNNPRWPSLTWPNSFWFDFIEDSESINYLYLGGLWGGAKKIRRNDEGEQLYWQNWPNPVDENDCIPATHPDWHEGLQLVVDTLTSVGYDGDRSLYELLPAYNPLEASSLGNQYYQYNHYDRVFFNRYGEEEYDDNALDFLQETGFPFFPVDDIYCSGLGSESSVAYYYDYSPFPDGYSGIRHYGSHTGNNIHYPLEVAVKQETFTWPVQYYSDIIFIKHTIYNTSEVDTLYDMSLAFYMDPDIGPICWGGSGLGDDLTTYVSGVGMEFPFSYDADGDGGLTHGKVAVKVLNEAEGHACWQWEVGDGPDDYNPRNVNPWGVTANEKYWLMTGRNPDTGSNLSGGRYINLRQDEQLYPMDTRFMYSIYGDMQGFDNPTEQSINLGPGEHKEFVSAIFLADTEEKLVLLAEMINEFYESGFDENLMAGFPSIPYIMNVNVEETTAHVEWRNFTIPDELYVYHKLRDAPASTWQEIPVAPEDTECYISNLDETQEHKFKIGAYFDGVYLESNTVTAGSALASEEEDTIHKIPTDEISIYPNPFNPSTTIAFELEKPSDFEISIYNLKGQEIMSYFHSEKTDGKQQYQWNGKDKNGVEVSSGIYFFQVKIGNEKMHVKKAVLMK